MYVLISSGSADQNKEIQSWSEGISVSSIDHRLKRTLSRVAWTDGDHGLKAVRQLALDAGTCGRQCSGPTLRVSDNEPILR
ncbi:hypothetical protein AOT83_24150 [Mycobacteroides sp. H001]|nr:hypothetical protein AOT86_03535 [Mycobacteroides sp. H072]KRQ35329.1 hypothetical protein AOT84_16895 [Mycobacteroides sp. H002]KRQ55346.1 hypothetical protein AOT85_02065 [Mycobacteroides sp. H054]KRQ66081.1 hypothetical protein AOT83_24150 [Mycobacteroides sp. H001]OHU44191.1 hypothetical protein BKG79_00475 [Mycobacteroides chelonae]